MISCGEPSGDLYAGALASEILRREPSADIFGLGGRRLAAAGARLVGDFQGLSVTGLTEALRVLPRSFAMLRRLTAAARAQRPDVFVAIDFPDFNLKLSSAIHRLGIPIVYYVTPQLWAWRSGRVHALKKIADRLLVIFPFESDFYREAGVEVEFVGHPLVDLAVAREPRDVFLRGIGLDPARPTVALLPGSRRNELQAIIPAMRGAMPLIASRVPPVQFLVARAPNLSLGLFDPLRAKIESLVNIVDGRTDDVLASADVVVTASGTATVQAAIHECPMVIVYRLSPLTYRIGKPFVHVDTYGMANLVAGERIVPELIQDELTSEAIAREALGFLEHPERVRDVKARLRDVRRRLGEPGVSRRVAERVIDVARAKDRFASRATARRLDFS
jgi:lipid-A-disaccharide synthase